MSQYKMIVSRGNAEGLDALLQPLTAENCSILKDREVANEHNLDPNHVSGIRGATAP